MDYKVLYRKYRPDNFGELVGQDHIKELLIRSILNEKLSHAYLFTGPRGTGKTSTAKLFAKIINCEKNIEGNPCNTCESCLNYHNSADIIEIDAASNNGVDEIRELRENVKISPTFSRYKIYIIDEVHMLSTSAWNAFLKTLEEPPKHVIFILATTELQKVPITVISRCQRFDFQRIDDDVIANKLQEISKKEKIKITKESLIEIAKLSDGGLRDALGILDQVSKLGNSINLDMIKNAYGIVTRDELDNLFENYNHETIEIFIDQINKFNSRGINGDILLNNLLEYLLDKLIEFRVNGHLDIQNIENIIIDLEECYQKRNKYLLIKTIFLKNLSSVKSETLEKPEIIIKEEKVPEIISREIIPDCDSLKIDEKLIAARINNSFAGADINLKKSFIKSWENLTNHFAASGDTKFLSLLKNTTVQVVSPTNVLLSTNTESNSILFNLICDEISEKCQKIIATNLKIICIDEERWKKEKAEYIKNKNKEYKLVEEPKIEKIDNKTVDIATEIFGQQLVEIK